MALHSEVAELAHLLNQLASLLKRSGDEFWSIKLDRCRAHIEKSDYHGVAQYLSLFGGMGSFADFELRDEKNERLAENYSMDTLREQSFAIAAKLAREHNAP